MTRFLSGVLSVIAAGVLLIAYGLLNPRAATLDARTDMNQAVRPLLAGERVMLGDAYPGTIGYASPAAYTTAPYAQPPRAAVASLPDARPVRTASVPSAAPTRETIRSVERPAGRNWKKTAMVIGGSSAAGAGVGAIFGGKKGALIGAAIGGGASTIYETQK